MGGFMKKPFFNFYFTKRTANKTQKGIIEFFSEDGHLLATQYLEGRNVQGAVIGTVELQKLAIKFKAFAKVEVTPAQIAGFRKKRISLEGGKAKAEEGLRTILAIHSLVSNQVKESSYEVVQPMPQRKKKRLDAPEIGGMRKIGN
jgi:hypothetical protein